MVHQDRLHLRLDELLVSGLLKSGLLVSKALTQAKEHTFKEWEI